MTNYLKYKLKPTETSTNSSAKDYNALRTFQDICNYLGADIAGMVYGSAVEAGEIKNNLNLLKEAYHLGEKLALSKC